MADRRLAVGSWGDWDLSDKALKDLKVLKDLKDLKKPLRAQPARENQQG